MGLVLLKFIKDVGCLLSIVLCLKEEGDGGTGSVIMENV